MNYLIAQNTTNTKIHTTTMPLTATTAASIAESTPVLSGENVKN
jgi:hypothetical protein